MCMMLILGLFLLANHAEGRLVPTPCWQTSSCPKKHSHISLATEGVVHANDQLAAKTRGHGLNSPYLLP
jgi:hypothetical protein